MAKNRAIQEPGLELSVVCAFPTTPASGDAVLFGSITGVALTAKGAGGNLPDHTSVDFRPGVWSFPNGGVKATGATSVGDKIYLKTSATPPMGNDNTGVLFGIALDAIGAGLTSTTARVMHLAQAT